MNELNTRRMTVPHAPKHNVKDDREQQEAKDGSSNNVRSVRLWRYNYS